MAGLRAAPLDLGSNRVLAEMTSWVRAVLVASALAFTLAGCGVKGSLETPPDAKADATADAKAGQGKPEGAAGKPHKGFVLDGLLR
jgi:predicted small lipoprotein YifL